MLGNFQQSQLRIAVPGNQKLIRDSLLKPSYLNQWLLPQTLSPDLPDILETGLKFTSSLGIITIEHQVEVADNNYLRMILSQGIDGYHEWLWGDGWVQSRLEGISLLPLNLCQTFSLLKLRNFLQGQNKEQE
ncbi:hypothetical protein VB715_21355 [Crocosphaera sp. UHCC 0190]|uniref:hypothetical protein n=1 Tax=Crocosphaera sp. UHCC 0190 TaxID=3110246 RepID=UPI002B21FD21|nr:hypothetical protein [Crocosphaera sp. UHCC 0190]MEA5512324.1 hypothetical protein [Crocosphaera sp. UHCC 0190]